MPAEDAKIILYRLGEQDKVLKSINDHATLTNGRVTRLELWQNRMIGGGAVVTFIVTVGIPIIIYILKHQ